MAEERPRVQLTQQFCKLFQALGLNNRCVSTSFGCRVNPAICVQGASSAESSNVSILGCGILLVITSNNLKFVYQLTILLMKTILILGICGSPRIAQ